MSLLLKILDSYVVQACYLLSKQLMAMCALHDFAKLEQYYQALLDKLSFYQLHKQSKMWQQQSKRINY